MTRFLDLGSTPLADSFQDDPNTGAPRYPLRLTVDESTWMVELEDHAPDGDLFGADYGFFTGSSPALVSYFADYAQWVRERYPRHVERGVIEIACNDGTLLQHFADGFHLGVDPAGPPTEAAKARGLNVATVPFTAEWASKIPAIHCSGVVIANNVTAHVPDLPDFLEGIAHLTSEGGIAVLEFQYLPDLLLGNGFDLVYHEHRRFLSLSSLRPALHQAGLDALDVVHTPTQGGSLRVVVSNATGMTMPVVEDVLRREEWLRSLDAYTSFAARVACVRDELRTLVDAERAAGRRVALYGAPAKATTMLHYCGLTRDVFDYAVDLTPAKIGKYIPGTDIQIVSPGQEQQLGVADTYLLASHNYLARIVRQEHSYLADGGHLIVPLPKPHII